ncbi:MAG: adenylate/guanylate cyclase domain-containing protein [Marinilabiliales bacterium]|nr:MAG: adenylate/guanylate cyclase domain-containing protein [Marinilabiliales bacterium]
MKNITKIVVLLFYSIVIFHFEIRSQDRTIDSLLTELLVAKDDTNKVNLLIELSKLNAYSSPDDAISYGMEAKTLSESLQFKNGLALSLKYIGMAYYFQAKYLETIQYWQESLTVYESVGNTKGVANTLSNIGAIYFNQGDDTKAIEIYLKALKVADEIGDSLRIATVLNNIGGVYFNKDATRNKSIHYYLRAYEICQVIGDQYGIGTSAVNLGGYYIYKENTDSALYYFNISLDILKKTATGNVSYVLNNIGEAYVLKEDYLQAENYQKQALELAEANNSALDMTLALIALGNTKNAIGDYKKAIEYYSQAEELAREIGVNYQLETAFKALAATYANISDYKMAYQYQKLFSEIKDTLYNAENDKKIQRLQFNYDLEKKQREVDNLAKDKELKELEIKRQKAVKNVFLLGLVFILIVAFILYRNMRAKIKINRILDRQKVEIENLLLNILPAKVANELQLNGKATPKNYKSVSVLFTDFKGFTKIAEGLSPEDLVKELNIFFHAFDNIVEKYQLEKIKTIGDAYMCAGGIPSETDDHPLKVVKAGLDMQVFMNEFNESRKSNGKQQWGLRLGIHTGPVVAGVVGKKKYAYDIWGNTVNIASRME